MQDLCNKLTLVVANADDSLSLLCASVPQQASTIVIGVE